MRARWSRRKGSAIKPPRRIRGQIVREIERSAGRGGICEDRRPARQVGGSLNDTSSVGIGGDAQLKPPDTPGRNHRQTDERTQRVSQIEASTRRTFARKRRQWVRGIQEAINDL